MLTFSPISKSYIFDRGYCHKKHNDFGQQSKLNLTSVLEERHSKKLSLPRIERRTENTPAKSIRVSEKRYTEFQSKIFDNPEFNDLEKQKIQKSQLLSKRLKQMKQMQLMQKNRLKLVRFENQSKESSIMNDFHTPKTNGGFSRSKTGGIYYK